MKITLAAWLVLFYPLVAYAYIGPGLGVGTIAVILGVVGSIFLALFAILWYPIKRIFKKQRNKEEKKPMDRQSEASDSH